MFLLLYDTLQTTKDYNINKTSDKLWIIRVSSNYVENELKYLKRKYCEIINFIIRYDMIYIIYYNMFEDRQNHIWLPT